MAANDLKRNADDILCSNLHGKYVIPGHHNRPVTRALREGRVWEPATIEFILNNHNNQSIVTAGTYIGDFLPAFRDIPEVIAFEPVKENWTYAKLNIKLNNLDNVVLENACLSNTNAKQMMTTYRPDGECCGGGSTVVTDSMPKRFSLPGWRYQEVSSMKLDDYLAGNTKPISIVQLDVERHETQALEGGLKTIGKYKPILIIEHKPAEAIENELFNMGYMYHSTRLHANWVMYIKGRHPPVFS